MGAKSIGPVGPVSCGDLIGATSSTYTIPGAGTYATGAIRSSAPRATSYSLRVVVTATNGAGHTEAASSQTSPVLPAAPVNIALPVIIGTPAVGNTVSTDGGDWLNTYDWGYQWQLCDESGGSCTDISGAINSEYVIQAGDAGGTLRVVVTVTNDGGSASATSLPTAKIAT